MKRIQSLILLTALLLTLSAACFAEDENPVCGEYTLFAVEMMGQQADPADLGMKVSLVLREDGKGALITNGAEEALSGWTAGDGKLTLYDEGGNALEAELRDGVVTMEMGQGLYMYFAAEGVDTAGFKFGDHSPGSALYRLCQSIDAQQGAHLRYDCHSDCMDALSAFDVHARAGAFYSRRTTKVNGFEQVTANFFKDGKSYVLYPEEKRGNLAVSISPGAISGNVLMLDDLYGEISRRAMRTDFTVETRELEGKRFQVELYPKQDYVPEAAFYYDDAGELAHVLVGPPQMSPELGETCYTVLAIDGAADDALFDISGYTITE